MADMRPSIVFINQYYWPDVAPTGQGLTDLAEWLAAEGYDVHVICGRSAYEGEIRPLPTRDQRNDVEISRVWMTAFGRRSSVGLFGRIIDYLTFLVSALCRAWRQPSDLLVLLTTPPFLPCVGLGLHLIEGRRYGIWSLDLHPEAQEALGLIGEGSRLGSALRRMGRVSHRKAEFVVSVGSRMTERLVERGVDRARIHEIPVWEREDVVTPLAPGESPMRNELGLGGKFVVLYSGNAGLGHRFEEVLEAARELQREPEVHFLFIGGGPKRPTIEEYTDRHELENVTYLDYLPREKIDQSLSLGHLHLVTLKPEMAGIAVPGKLQSAMAAGRPILFVGPSDAEPARRVNRYGIGAVVDPSVIDDPVSAIVEIIDGYRREPERVRVEGKQARQVFLARYERRVACAEWQSVIEERLSAGHPD